MFYEGDKVRTLSKVTQETKDILVANGIKPGQQGIVVMEIVSVVVNFDGKIVTINEDALEFINNPSSVKSGSLKDLMDIFGMK